MPGLTKSTYWESEANVFLKFKSNITFSGIPELKLEIDSENFMHYDERMWIESMPDFDRAKMRKALCTLTPREEAIIRVRFGIDSDPKTLAKIGMDFGVG